MTNSTGYFITTFAAPNVTTITNVRIIATASKMDYAQGSDHMYLTVLPLLSVEVTADPVSMESEATSEVTTHVMYGGQPVADAVVTIWSDGGGNFSATTGTTDLNGTCVFIFTAPKTTELLNITITATATKAGYAGGEGQTEIAIEPKILAVKLTADPTTVDSEEFSHVTVRVTYDKRPISDVNVALSSDYGTLSPETGTTNSNGTVTFAFTAPEALTQLNVTITAIATRAGYVDGEGQLIITVNPKVAPEPGVAGLPLITIFIIAAVIVVIAIVVLLIKLNIVQISWRQE